MTFFYLTLFALSSVAFAAPSQDYRGVLLGSCDTSQYICKSNIDSPFQVPKCINLSKLCDLKKDCPLGDDEKNQLCDGQQKLKAELDKLQEQQQNQQQNQTNNNKEGLENDFSGTGFMFSVNNLVIEGGSNVKMFNQNSDNTGEKEAKSEEESNLIN